MYYEGIGIGRNEGRCSAETTLNRRSIDRRGFDRSGCIAKRGFMRSLCDWPRVIPNTSVACGILGFAARMNNLNLNRWRDLL